MNWLKTLSLGAALAAGLSAPTSAAEPDVLSFGIVPQQSASRLAKMWGPLIAELSARSGKEIRLRTTKDIPTFEACLKEGAFDIAYMNPMHYAVFAEDGHYRAILRQAEKRLKGLIVARIDGATSLADLDGTQLAFPSPGAFGASVLTRAKLKSEGVAFDPAYVKSHDSVYRAVAAGLMAGGGGVLRTFNAVAPEIRDQLTVIHETESFTPHAIALQSRVDARMGEELQATLMEIAQSAPDLVNSIGMNGFQPSTDADWDDVRALSMPASETGILSAEGVTCPSG